MLAIINLLLLTRAQQKRTSIKFTRQMKGDGEDGSCVQRPRGSRFEVPKGEKESCGRGV